MEETEALSARVEPLPADIKDIQPGGGACMRIELAWGRWRRWYLKTFRRGYVAKMQQTREGTANGCPHEVLDPRDVRQRQDQVVKQTIHGRAGRRWWRS